MHRQTHMVFLFLRIFYLFTLRSLSKSTFFSICFTPEIIGEILRLDDCWKYGAKFKTVHRDKVLVGSILATFNSNKTEGCINGCVFHRHCESVNVRKEDHLCQLNSWNSDTNGAILEVKKGWYLLETSDEEQNVSKSYFTVQ